jgi:glyoxylase-like metal-dependent hydrolase (beta-lactamase superfamily II)
MDMAGLRILETPGHAAHHLCYSLDQSVFVGEAVGCPYYQGEKVYCRPATPPRYYPEPTFDSLNKLFKLSEELGVDEAYFAHTQEKGPLKATVLAYQEQLKLWDKIIHPLWLAKNKATNLSELRVHLTDHLFEVDPQLRPLQALAPEALEIEKYFMRNCVDGFLGLYEERKARKSL